MSIVLIVCMQDLAIVDQGFPSQQMEILLTSIASNVVSILMLHMLGARTCDLWPFGPYSRELRTALCLIALSASGETIVL